jgi:O-antigen ligase
LFRGVVEDLYGAANDGGIALSQIEYLIFKNVIRPMPIIFLFVFYYVYLMNNKSSTNKDRFILSKYMVALVFVLSVFFLSPTSVSRYMVAALYIPFVIIFTKAWDAPYRMQTTMLGALIILMPILDIFRNFNPENIKLSIGLHYLNQEHFDAYQNFTRVVDVDFITYGYQLMGAIFFFVPRSLWEEKPIGSGAALAQLQEYHFANISMPFLGEGYVNFGVLGVLFFMFFLGLLVGNFDKLAWKIMKTTKHHIILYYYYIVFGILFFLLRGDLLSSFAYFVGITISFLLVVYLFKFSSIRFKL